MSSVSPEFARVVEIMRRLRAPDGCPWDRKQTLDSIRPHTIEEAYEVLEAIGDRNWPGLREELGDLLLQVVFYAEIAEEQGLFNMQDVLTTLAEKLVRRHPHVFAEPRPLDLSPEEALGRWNAMKAEEKKAKGPGEGDGKEDSLLAGIPKDLPALAEAAKVSQRVARAGFDWPDTEGVWDKIQEELRELRAEVAEPQPGQNEQMNRQEEEMGDVLFSIVNLARRLKLDPEAALKAANRKFTRRFQAMEAAGGRGDRRLDQLSAAEWDELWRAAKQENRAR